MTSIKQSTIIGVIGIIILIPLIFPEYNSFWNSISTDNKNIIIVKESGGFLLGPSNITIILKKNNNLIRKLNIMSKLFKIPYYSKRNMRYFFR